MTRLVYVDTCVYLNAANEEEHHEEAWDLFFRSHGCEFHLVLSDWVLTELGGHLKPGRLAMTLKMLKKKKKFMNVETEEAEDKEVDSYIGENADDYKHVVLALKAGAECLVTRNLQHFKAWSHLIEIKLPEDV